ncbi:MAG: PilZ domain-containing protein [Desulfobacteraceae bacterium]|nr:MAG: PilZ domain-containing protein [Desulfobacteraceae bacterium]
MSDPADRRKHYRLDARWPVTIILRSGAVEGETTNISAQGVSITCDESLLLGVSVTCDETLLLNEICTLLIRPPDYDAIKISGKVVWSDMHEMDGENKTVGIGVCIVEISDKDRGYFKDILYATAV